MKHNKRFTWLIPELFLFMILLVAGFSLHYTQLNQQLYSLVRLITWQWQLREDYVLSVYGSTQSLVEKPAVNPDIIMNQLIHNLYVQLNGGSVRLPGDKASIVIVKIKQPHIRKELLRKITLHQQLSRLGHALTTAPSKANNASKTLAEFNHVFNEIEQPKEKILNLYLYEIKQQINQIVWMEISILLLTSLAGLFLSIRKKQNEQLLANSELRLRQIFETSPIGKAFLDAQGNILEVNKAFEAMLGYPNQELLNQSIDSLSPPEELEQEHAKRALLFNGEIKSYQAEKRYRRKEGQWIWLLASSTIINNPEGKPDVVVLQVQDISALKNTTEALRLSEMRFRNIIESATDGIVVANMDNIIVSANSEVHRIFGYAPGVLGGRTLVTLIPPIYREAHLKSMQRVKETHHSRLSGKLLELQGLHKNGRLFPVELSLSAWEGPDGNMMATAIIRDISERKQLQREREALLQSNKNLEEFALIASHDLQEPLRKIAIFAERLSKREQNQLTEESKKDIQRLLTGVYRMQALISDLLAYARILPQQTRFEAVNLNQVLQQITRDLDSQFKETGGTITSEPLPSIEADKKQMEVLFKNLIQNALKYRRSGVCPIIHIYGKLRQYQTESYAVPLLEISVEDNGIGFDEKYLDRIFKVFQRLHSPSEFSGTGIGLATCRKIIEQHQGNITARSQPGKGSTFLISLPVYQK